MNDFERQNRHSPPEDVALANNSAALFCFYPNAPGFNRMNLTDKPGVCYTGACFPLRQFMCLISTA